MKNIANITLTDLSPYIRLVQYFEANEKNYYVPWRIIYDYELIYVVDGECIVETDTDTYSLKSGDVHIMAPFIRHKHSVKKNNGKGKFYYYDVHFDWFYDKNNIDFSAKEVYQKECWSMVEKAIVDLTLIKRKIYSIENIPNLEVFKITNRYVFQDLCERMVATWESNTKNCKLKTKGLFLQIIAELFEELESSSEIKNNNVINNYLLYIIDNYSKEIDFNEISSQQGFSPNYFRKIFKSVVHKAPHEFLIDYRMEQAKKLLLTKQYTVTEVSFMIGYDDYHYFSRLFKNKEGVSPKEFLKNNN